MQDRRRDHERIDRQPIKPWEAISIRQDLLDRLEAKLVKRFSGRTLVITHMASRACGVENDAVGWLTDRGSACQTSINRLIRS